MIPEYLGHLIPAWGSNWGYSGFSHDRNNHDSSAAYVLWCERKDKHMWHNCFTLIIKYWISFSINALLPRSLKGEPGLFFFDPCVNTMEWRPYCPSRMEVSYCTFRFGAIIRRDLCTLSLPHDSPPDNQYACLIWVHAGKATHASQNYLAGLAMKKIQRYNNSPLYVMAR